MRSRTAPDPAAETQRQAKRTHGPRREDAICLTIAYHAELERVGERAFLGDLARPVAVSRLEPLFAPPGDDDGLALADGGLSRQPFSIARQREELRIDAPPAVGLAVDGQPVSGTRLVPASALEEGVLLGLAGRALLLLHTTPVPRWDDTERDLGLVGQSRAMLALREEIRAAARLEATVLVRGETGSGKELVARALHAESPRARGPLAVVNLGAIPETLAASELFGHQKGAFSGAAQAHDGYFARAHKGTLFLDEIGELPEALQPLVLRALESGEIQPVGAGEVRRVDVRVIAATDLDLEQAVADGRFRAPLYHRLAAYVLRVPPLRERREDIPRLLAKALLAQARDRALDPGLLCAAFARALGYAWPGNVRELQNAVARLVVASEIGRGLGSWPALSDAQPAPSTATRELGPQELEPEALRALLHRHGWKVGAASAELGVTRKTLYAAMQRAGLRNAHAIEREEIDVALAAAQGDLEGAAEALELTKRALVLRMKQLGMGEVSG